MSALFQRKTAMILALSASLAATLIVLALDTELRERLGTTYWLLGLAIIGSILLVMAGYVWDRSLMDKLRAINKTARTQNEQIENEADHPVDFFDDEFSQDPDEIIGLARQIERMAQTLQKVEASYRGVVEDQVDLICRYRADGKITFVNAAYAKFYGKKRAQLLGQRTPLFDLGYPKRDFQGNLPEVSTFELQLNNNKDTPISFTWTHRAIKSPGGTIMEYQGVGHDISAQKEAETALVEAKEAAESADRAKSEFLAVVSHEVRTPINAVIGFSKLLRETNVSADQIEYISNIHQSGITLETLITDILDVSRLEAGQIEVKQMPFSLRDSMEDLSSHFTQVARNFGLAFTLKVDPNVPVILNGDHARMRQILMNIIGNGIKFTEQGGIDVTVTCARGENADEENLRKIRLFFTVTDTGIGIPSSRVAELFKPFSQLDSSSTRRRGGTGLGLVISKRLCELMGGAISVDSVPNQGSTFRFSLAMTYQKGDSKPPIQAPSPNPGLRPSPSVA
jgi:PAS domain S-box-containing protein